MAWRSQGITGSNNIPLGNRRRFGGETSGNGELEQVIEPHKRGRSPEQGKPYVNTVLSKQC